MYRYVEVFFGCMFSLVLYIYILKYTHTKIPTGPRTHAPTAYYVQKVQMFEYMLSRFDYIYIYIYIYISRDNKDRDVRCW